MSDTDNLLLVSRKGMSARFPADDETLRPMGRATSGVIGMRFRGNDALLAIDVVQPDTFVVTITDGHENASNEFDRDALTQLIRQREADGWEFQFLAADLSGDHREDLDIAERGQHGQQGPGGRDERGGLGGQGLDLEPPARELLHALGEHLCRLHVAAFPCLSEIDALLA